MSFIYGGVWRWGVSACGKRLWLGTGTSLISLMLSGWVIWWSPAEEPFCPGRPQHASCNVSRHDAFYCSSVKVTKAWHRDFALVSFLENYSNFWAFLEIFRYQVLCEAKSQEHRTVHLLHLRSTDADRVVCLCLLFIESMIIFLVLLMLSSRLFSKHHSARCLIDVWNLANDGGLVWKLYSRVLSVLGITLMGVQREQKRAEHTAVGAP